MRDGNICDGLIIEWADGREVFYPDKPSLHPRARNDEGDAALSERSSRSNGMSRRQVKLRELLEMESDA
jgi:hypothetical protein